MIDDIANRLRQGEYIFTAWSAIPNHHVAEACARTDFDAVTLDMQHGMQSTESVVDGIGAIALAGKAAIVRIPIGDFSFAGRALDFGASAIIAPMINSGDDARAFAAAMKYPPVGERSWAPYRAIALNGYGGNQDYLEAANDATLSLAMIETHAAVAALDDILAVDGIDGVFVGPSDLSIAWSEGKTINPALDDMMEAIADIGRRARAAGKVAAIFMVDPTRTAAMAEHGYQFFALGRDGLYLASGAASALTAARAGL